MSKIIPKSFDYARDLIIEETTIIQRFLTDVDINDKPIYFDNLRLDLRNNLEQEIPRGTIAAFHKRAEFSKFIVYYSRLSAVFYDRETGNFLFALGEWGL